MCNNLLIIKLYLGIRKNFEDVLLKTFKMSSCEDDETDIIFMREGLFVGRNTTKKKKGGK